LNLFILANVQTFAQIIKPSIKRGKPMFLNITKDIKKVFAIACVSIAVGAATLPSLASAQNSTQNNNSTQTEKRRPRQGDAFKQLNLTDAQKAELKKIRESAKTERRNILTPEQRAKIEQALTSGERGGSRKDLNLTDAQKQQMRSIGQETKKKVDGILTPEQKQQLEKIRQERQSQKNNRRDR
jgi:Spy/CpxP family protein refolding chaperone